MKFCCFPKPSRVPHNEIILPPDQTSMQDAVSTPEVFSVLELDRSAWNDIQLVEDLRQKISSADTYFADLSGDFIPNGESGDVRLWYRPRNEIDPLIAKGEILIRNEHDIDLVLEVLTGSKHRAGWDLDNLRNIHIRDIHGNNLENGKERVCQVYNAFKGRFGQPGRDFVFNEYTCKLNNHKAICLIYSNPEDQCPLGFEAGNRGNFIRANTILGAYQLEKEPNGIRVHFINQTDIGGKLPDWISDMVLKKSPEKLSYISIYISKLRNNNMQ